MWIRTEQGLVNADGARLELAALPGDGTARRAAEARPVAIETALHVGAPYERLHAHGPAFAFTFGSPFKADGLPTAVRRPGAAKD